MYFECLECKNRFFDIERLFLFVFKAINGPLQQRTNVLDLDSSRANSLPLDYDTDLESEWANPRKMLSIVILNRVFLSI